MFRVGKQEETVLEQMHFIPNDIRDEKPMKHCHARTCQPTLNPQHASSLIREDGHVEHQPGNQGLQFVPPPEDASVPAKYKEIQLDTFAKSSMT